jgi:V8-like Glu-specific endopeptidase
MIQSGFSTRLRPIRGFVVAALLAAALLGFRGHLAAAAEKPAATKLAADRAGKIFGTDDRELITETTAQPWATIGYVLAVFGDNTTPESEAFGQSGTGVLVGTRTVATAAHVVYNDEKGWPNAIYFIPGKNGDMEPFGRIRVVLVDALSGYVSEGNDDRDFALLVLEEDVGRRTGYMGVSVQPASFFVNRQLHHAGYAADIGSGGRLYHATGPSRDLDGLIIRHEIDAEMGHSGGPVWFDQGDQHYLVGIHTGNREVLEGGELVDSYNTAVHINEEIYNKMRDTMLANDTVVYPELGTQVESTVGTSTACPAAAVALLSLWGLMLVAARRGPRPTRPVSRRSGPSARRASR